MLTESGLDAGLAGNVGLAPLEIADKHQIVVFELSSYQTADMAFSPDIAAVTNLTPEHTDWHRDVERYYRRQAQPHRPRSALPGRARRAAPRTIRWCSRRCATARACCRRLAPFIDDRIAPRCPRSRLKGAHNLDNALLAAQIALAAGADLEGIVRGIKAFVPLPHRLEEHQIGGITVVDDSISTTPEATKAALAAYAGKRIALIAGGHERQQDYTELAVAARAARRHRAGLPAGHRRPAGHRHLCRRAARSRCSRPARSKPAMQALAARRDKFDTVILSPGAPSYGQLEAAGVVFKNFEERGDGLRAHRDGAVRLVLLAFRRR